MKNVSWTRTHRLALIGSVIAISLEILLPAVVSFAQTVSFNPTTNFAVGTTPVSVAIGDLNRDGRPDLAVANQDSDNISILLGTGIGAFGAATNFTVGTNPSSVAIGDLNGDGKPDLAVANNNSANVSILLGTGTGAYGAATTFGVGTQPYAVAIGDLNGDGKPDLAVANFASSSVSILLGDGTGAFGAMTTFAAGLSPMSVAIEDLNGDGKPDLAVANFGISSVSILLGDGTGAFGAATTFAAGVGPYFVAIGDLNGDGKLDLATANVGGGVSILLGDGTGAFGAATTFGVGSPSYSIAIGDLNGDGKPDLAVANANSSNVSILLNTTTYSPSGAFGAATNFAVGSSQSSVAIGDLNGDGKLDLATANVGGGVSILLGDGIGAFGAATNFAVGSSPYAVAIEDLNGDGNLDLAVTNVNSNSVSILLGTGTGAFGLATNFTVVGAPTSVAIGDLNGDGKPDLTVSNRNNTVSVLLGMGTGSFGTATNFAVGGGPTLGDPTSIAIGDLNGDGKPDLAVANPDSNNVSVLLGSGTGSFGAATNFDVGSCGLNTCSPGSVAIRDLNGDGIPDLAVVNFLGGSVSILLGTGTGSFGAVTKFSVGLPFPESVAIGDLNRDGKPDLVFAKNFFGGTVAVLLGNGFGSFGAPTNFTAGNGLSSVAIGDFNGDGKPDLAVTNLLNGNVSILLNIPPAFTVSVSPAGTGSGMVTSSPAGINCGSTCSAPFDSGTVVTLTATPNATFTFTGWSGACTGTGTCTVTMDAAKSVTATFDVLNTYYRDDDGDTYGDPIVTTLSSTQPAGYVTNSSDCNDSNASIHPGAIEVCNGVDDNCNGQIDEGVQNTYYRDADSDTYGNASVTTLACIQPLGYVSNSTDCNDSNAAIHPGAAEVCGNGVDDNCNGQIDEGCSLSVDLSITNADSPDPVTPPGQNVTYTITVTNNGPSPATGVTVTDVLDASLTLVSATPSQVGPCTGTGPITCNLGSILNGSSATVTVVATTGTTPGMISSTASVTAAEPDPNMANNSAMATTNVGAVSKLLAISTRAYVSTGNNREIAGFIIGGSLPKKVILRGRGPSMGGAPFNITGTLSNPYLRLFSSTAGAYIAQNDNWGDQSDPLCAGSGYVCETPAAISATGLDPCMPNPGQTSAPPNCSNESAILITLPPGAYTAVLSGVNNGKGVGLVEVYDTDGNTLQKITAISTRAQVLTGANRMIGGITIGAGSGSRKFLIKARGPSMGGAPFNITGTLSNPYVRLYSSTAGAYIAQNDNWGDQSDPLCSSSGFVCGTPAEISATGMDPCVPNPGQTSAPPNCSNESAILITVPSGSYTAVVSGVNGGTGVGLVEVYEVP